MSPVVTIANAIKVFVVVALVIAAGWWIWSGHDDTFRYRLTVAVESDGKIYTGSGVIQVQMHFQEFWSPSAFPKVTADAVVIDVPGHEPVFALLTARNNVDWDAAIAFQMFQDRFPLPRSVRGDTRTLANSRETATIPAKWYPMLVAFRDIADPKSVYELNPDDLSPPLAPDARVASVTVEMTRDAATYAVEKWLPWLTDIRGNLLGKIMKTTSALADNLGAAAFKKRGT